MADTIPEFVLQAPEFIRNAALKQDLRLIENAEDRVSTILRDHEKIQHLTTTPLRADGENIEILRQELGIIKKVKRYVEGALITKRFIH